MGKNGILDSHNNGNFIFERRCRGPPQIVVTVFRKDKANLFDVPCAYFRRYVIPPGEERDRNRNQSEGDERLASASFRCVREHYGLISQGHDRHKVERMLEHFRCQCRSASCHMGRRNSGPPASYVVEALMAPSRVICGCPEPASAKGSFGKFEVAWSPHGNNGLEVGSKAQGQEHRINL